MDYWQFLEEGSKYFYSKDSKNMYNIHQFLFSLLFAAIGVKKNPLESSKTYYCNNKKSKLGQTYIDHIILEEYN